MADSFVLLNDGSSFLVLNDGTSKVILNAVEAVPDTNVTGGQIRRKLKRLPPQRIPFQIVLPVWGRLKKDFESDDVITFGLIYEKVFTQIPYNGIKMVRETLKVLGTSKEVKVAKISAALGRKVTVVKEFKVKGKQDFSKIRAKLLGLFRDGAI